ncbi:MAG: GNAT family N-acetyltransferase, partial [Verrucomicrobia bacterium]|nr:GNAT family N-acetyltransferase [Verrucomicrobiota bacterium]
MKYTLRPATNQDREAVESLVFGVLAEYGLSADPGGTDSDLHDIQAAYHAAGGALDLMVGEAGTIVGSVGLVPLSSSLCELRKMYLVREVRGHGWGRVLLEHALKRASELGFSRVVLETASVLREAVSLYERFGFRRY